MTKAAKLTATTKAMDLFDAIDDLDCSSMTKKQRQQLLQDLATLEDNFKRKSIEVIKVVIADAKSVGIEL